VQHSWNDWVLNYDDQRQRLFLSQLDLGIDNWSDMVITLVVLLVVVTGLFWLVFWYRERPPRPEAYEILFNRLMRKLAKRGFDRKPSEDTRAFLQRVSQQDFAQREQLARIIELYNRIKYGRDGNSPPALNSMRSMIKSMHL
jgi:hypothetical protein